MSRILAALMSVSLLVAVASVAGGERHSSLIGAPAAAPLVVDAGNPSPVSGE